MSDELFVSALRSNRLLQVTLSKQLSNIALTKASITRELDSILAKPKLANKCNTLISPINHAHYTCQPNGAAVASWLFSRPGQRNSSSYFNMGPKCRGPRMNEDTERVVYSLNLPHRYLREKTNLIRVPHIHFRSDWTAAENKGLEDGIRVHNKNWTIVKKPIASNHSIDNIDTCAKYKDLSLSSSILNDKLSMLEKNPPFALSNKTVANDIDWEWLARRYVPSRSSKACRIQWQKLNPSLSTLHWSNTEDVQLLICSKKRGFRDWLNIAEDLKVATKNTKVRHPIDCYQRYLHLINRDSKDKRGKNVNSVSTNIVGMKRKRWSQQEDAALKRGMALYGANGNESNSMLKEFEFTPTNWQLVAASQPELKDRDATSCLHHWISCIDPTIKFGPWTTDESIRLLVTAQAYYPSSPQINVCDTPSEDIPPVTVDTGECVKKDVKDSIKLNYKAISQYIKGRSAGKCRAKYLKLRKQLKQ